MIDTPTVPMVSVFDLINSGASDVVLDIGGLEVPVRLRRNRGGEAEKYAYKRLVAAVEEVRAYLQRPKEEAAPAEEGSSTEGAIQNTLAVLEAELAVDGRREVLVNVVAWLVSWKLTDGDGQPLPLDVDALYELPVPLSTWTGLLAAILAKRAELDSPAPIAVDAPSPTPTKSPAPRRRKAAAAR